MIHLLGVPYDSNSSFLRGASGAPDQIRKMESSGSANPYTESIQLIASSMPYKDLGNLKIQNLNPSDAFEAIRAAVKDIIGINNKLLCLGGDHSVSFPLIDAHTDIYTNLHVLQLDAHADLYENFDGNPYSHASPFARLLEKGRISSLTQLGVRTLNPHQLAQAEKYGVRIVTMKDFYSTRIELPSPLYISLDLDVLDPAFAPGISHHEPGGLSTRELLQVIDTINAEVIGADIVEYNPTRDINDMTAMLAYKLMKEIMAKMVCD